MNRRLLIKTVWMLVAGILLTATVGGCKNPAVEPAAANSQDETSTKDDSSFSSDMAEQLLSDHFGTADPDTGNTYSFGYIGNCTIDGIEYYAFQWSWLVSDHMSKISDLMVKTDGSAVYEGLYSDTGSTIYSFENQLDE